MSCNTGDWQSDLPNFEKHATAMRQALLNSHAGNATLRVLDNCSNARVAQDRHWSRFPGQFLRIAARGAGQCHNIADQRP